MTGLRRIAARALMERLGGKDEHAILDTRREGDFAKGHLFFASNAPRALLELRIERLVPRRATPIALCASNDAEAEDAARILNEFGYDDVAVLEAGIEGWTRDGGQLFSGVNVPSKAFGEFVEQSAHTPHIGAAQLRALLDSRSDVVILDSRPYSEYQAMSIPGAIDCPGGELVYRAGTLVNSRDTTIIVNCAGRTRSIIGTQSLIDSGIANRVLALRDGTMGWHLAGFELEHQRTGRASSPVNPRAAQEGAARIGRAAGVRIIDAAEIDALRREDRTVYLFDVRDPEEYARGHRGDAISAPGGQLLQTLDTSAAVRNATILVTDREGARAPVIAAWLRQMGWNDVYCAIDPAGEGRTDGPPTPMADAIMARAKVVSAADAFAMIRARDAVVVDLANSKEYLRGHIPGALWCERQDVESHAARDRTLILTSPDGRLAALTAANGPECVAIDGGTAAWIRAGFPLEADRGNLPVRPNDVFYRPYDLAEDREQAMQAYLDWEKNLVGRLAGEPGISFWRVKL